MHGIFVQAYKNTSVGFTTKLGGHSSVSTVIRGSKVLFNQGNAYNGTVFTCPSPGLYFFHVSVITSTSGNGIWIFKNFKELTLAFSGASPSGNGASVSAATWLKYGDQVYLLPLQTGFSLDGNSAFTGIKII